MTNSLAQNRSTNDPLTIAANRLAKDVTPDRMAAMLDELGVEDSWTVVEDAGRIVSEARQEFNRSWKVEMRKATIAAAAGVVIALVGLLAMLGVDPFATTSDQTLPTVAAIVGGVLCHRGLKRRDQLGRQSFRNTFRFNA